MNELKPRNSAQQLYFHWLALSLLPRPKRSPLFKKRPKTYKPNGLRECARRQRKSS
jgi:hypothetical protein